MPRKTKPRVWRRPKSGTLYVSLQLDGRQRRLRVGRDDRAEQTAKHLAAALGSLLAQGRLDAVREIVAGWEPPFDPRDWRDARRRSAPNDSDPQATAVPPEGSLATAVPPEDSLATAVPPEDSLATAVPPEDFLATAVPPEGEAGSSFDQDRASNPDRHPPSQSLPERSAGRRSNRPSSLRPAASVGFSETSQRTETGPPTVPATPPPTAEPAKSHGLPIAISISGADLALSYYGPVQSCHGPSQISEPARPNAMSCSTPRPVAGSALARPVSSPRTAPGTHDLSDPSGPSIPTETDGRPAREIRIGSAARQAQTGGPTLGEAVRRYLDWSRRTHRLATWRDDHCARLNRLVERFGEATPLTAIHLAAIEDHLGDLQKKGLARSTVWGHTKTLRAFFKRLVAWKLLAESPLAELKQPRQPERRPDFLTEKELDDLIAAARGTRFLVPIAIGAFAGLRLGELIRLEWDDIDFDRRLLHVRNKVGRDRDNGDQGQTEGLTKSGRERAVSISERLFAILEAAPRRSRFVVVNTRGGPYRSNLRRDLQRLAARVGIDRFTVHLLRHTFASRHVARGVSLYKVQKWMGHATSRMTERYAHLAAEWDPDIEGPRRAG